MAGFSEKGQPADWDMAVGTVRGFRWWNLSLSFTTAGSYYDRVAGLSYNTNRMGLWPPLSPWVPVFRRAGFFGMHGGSWFNPVKEDGWHIARCDSNSPYSAGHSVPNPYCGCGFWAYWDNLDHDAFSSNPYIRYDRDVGYEIAVPVGGVVEGAGRTIVGEKGFRAERVRITDLAFSREHRLMYQDITPRPIELVADSLDSVGLSYENCTQFYSESVPDFLSRYMQVPAPVIQQAMYDAVVEVIGSGFRWHGSTDVMEQVVPRDENYGSKQ